MGKRKNPDEALERIAQGVARAKQRAKENPVDLSPDAASLVTRRAAARKAKDWAESDALRDALVELGYTVSDTKGEQVVSSVKGKQGVADDAAADASDASDASDDSGDSGVSAEAEAEAASELKPETQPAKQKALSTEEPKVAKADAKSDKGAKKEIKLLKLGVKIADLKIGDGNVVKRGTKLSMSYVGRFNTNTGKVFDKSGRTAFKFKLGAGEVIKGWDIGVVGMRVGGKRRITVPAKAGYGKHRTGKIPGNSTLCFDVEVLGDPTILVGEEVIGF